MVLIAVLSVCLTVMFTIAIFYGKFQDQIIADLKSHAHILLYTQNFLEDVERDYDPKIDNLRITVIDADGKVEYDSNADIGAMDNHAGRPEVQEALRNGSGYVIRESDTLDKRTYYYAELLSDGRVLRGAKEADRIWEFLFTVLPLLLALLVVMLFLSIMMARLLARQMIQPVEQLALHLDSDNTPIHTYVELQPFLDKIHKQHQELRKSARLRQEFTANVSHELKTPLASISGYAELIETGIAGEKDTQHFASEIHKNANRLLALINDIIHLSKLDVMTELPQMKPLNLTAVADNTVEMLQLQAEKHHVELMMDRRDGQISIRGNQSMIEEVLYNLCDNAIRYNRPGGHVWVSVYSENYESVVEVKDDGIGIPEEDQGRIFERFYRVDKGRSKETGGTGLGLAIVKHIVEQHHAELILDSALGRGTKIQIRFGNVKD